MFKTRSDTFGNDFGHFWNFANFLIFWNHFKDSTFFGTLGKKNFQKNYAKACSKHVWTIWERFWAFFEFWKFFKNFSKTRPSLEHWAKNFFKKITPKHGSKHVWTLLGTILIIFGILQIFWKHFEDSTLLGTLVKKLFQKITPKHVQNTFGQIGNDCGRFLNFESFLKTFRRLDPPWNTGQKNFLEKIIPKHVQNTFWHFWERFWAFLEFCKFFDFLKPFQRLDILWNAGQKKFSKKLRQSMFKTRLDNLGTILGVFWILKVF